MDTSSSSLANTFILAVPQGPNGKYILGTLLFDIRTFFKYFPISEKIHSLHSYLFYTIQISSDEPSYPDLLTKGRLKTEFSYYKDTKGYQALMDRPWNK